MVASWRPDLALAVAFNADPNDVGATPVWTNQTFRLRHADSIKRGRQYELDQNQTGQPTMVLWDPDEYLNPANTSAPAPYTGNVLPYRQILMQAVWPNPCSGNLLNSGAVPTGYDPDFENTAVGQPPPNVLPFHTSPTVQAANPWHGTKSLQWSVAGNSTEQVTGFTIPCIPGRPYIASVYYRQTAANTGVIFVNGGATGTSTTTAGAYVRLSVAFVATQPTHQLFVGSYTPTLASTVNIDAIQLEQPAPLNANPTFEAGTADWTATGGTIGLSKAWQQQGTYSMLLTPDGVSSQCYASSELIPVTPNTPYLVAGWVYAPNAIGSGNFTFGVNWFDASHTYISTPGTALTLGANTVTERDDQLTSPANAAYAALVPVINGTPTTSQKVYVDNVALYPATPSAFTTSGSVIYPVLRDYVERWPSEWDPDSAGFAGLAEITCVDALAVLQGAYLHTEYRNMLLSKAPTYYWPLTDGSNVTTFAEVSGNDGPPLVRTDSGNGPAATYAPGTQTNIAGDPGGTGVKITDPSAGLSTGSWTVLQTGASGSGTPQINFGGAPPVAFTAAVWISYSTLVGSGGTTFSLSDSSYLNQFLLFWEAGSAVFNYFKSGSSSVATAPITDSWADGKPHLFVLTANVGTSTATVNLYVDGTLVGSGGPTSTSGWQPPYNLTWIQLAGSIGLGGAPDTGFPDGLYSHFALFQRELSAQDVTDLWNAGKGFAGETSGARVARYLSYSYTGTTAVDTGQSAMSVATVTENTTALAAIQQVTLSENGNFWIDASGTVQFAARTRRYYATTPKYVFGENTAAGEIPYAGDVKFDFDPTLVYNDVEVTRNGGIVARASDDASQKRYFKRGYQRTIDVASDYEAIDAADWLLNTHKDPHQRVEQITLDPSSNPAIWPVVLGLEVGTRVTVKRRAKAGNAGAGLTMSADYFVESIEHSGIDMDSGAWTTTLLLSPAIGYQVGIFDDATYGRFDQTLVFGY